MYKSQEKRHLSSDLQELMKLFGLLTTSKDRFIDLYWRL